MAERGISAYRLAKDTGISDSLIGYWRAGQKKPGADNLVRLSKHFDVSMERLLGIEEPPPAPPWPPTEREVLVQEIAGVLNGLSVEKLKALREFLGSW